MTAYFRVTVEDLETGHTRSVEVAYGDYILIPFGDCHVASNQRYGNGTVQLTLKGHHPAGPSRNPTETFGGAE